MSEYSYAKLASECRITIPSLQRAYAQGRATSRATEIRNNFITDIKEALDKNTKLSLDTVYGELDKNNHVFTPLDGQQRLTTLFLLHLYLARYAEKAIGKIKFLTDDQGKSKLRYATRTSSEDFCDYLVKKDFRVGVVRSDAIIPPSFDDNGQEKEGITQRIIKSDMDFQWTWYNDPTIAAMLNMLDTIHKIFCGDNAPSEDFKEKCRGYYQKLVPDDDNGQVLVTFWYQEITGAIPADDLYVRMNARGLALTEFENYKAALFHFLGHKNPTTKTIKQKIDSEWQTAIWNYCKDKGGNIGISTAKAVDTILLRILHMCILFELMQKYLQDENRANHTRPEQLVKDFNAKKRFDQYELSQCEYYRDLNPDEKENLSAEIIRLMELTMNAIKDKSVNDQLAKLLDVNNTKKFSYDFVLYFYLRYYLVPKAGGQTEICDVLERLIKYSYISEFKNFENALNALFELTPNANGFLRNFRDAANPEEFVHNGFAKNQTWEEHLKLRMKDDDEWKRSIEEAERSSFFDGQILFLFECLLDGNISDLDTTEKTSRFKVLVDRKEEPELRGNFGKYFEFCEYAFSPQNSNLLRKLLMLRSILLNNKQDSLPVYPFTPEYAKDWTSDNALILRNPGSMILDSEDGDKLSWKRVLRIDLSNQKNDKAEYRNLIKTVVKAACDEQGDTIADKMKSLLNEWQVKAENELNPSANGENELSGSIFQNVRKTLLEWCKQQNWNSYNHSGIRLHDCGQLYLLGGVGEKLRDNYQELHMMLMKACLGEIGCQINCYGRGRLTIPLETQDEEIQLEFYKGEVRGRRCQRDRNSDLHWETCSYTPEEVIGLIERLKNVDVTQVPPGYVGKNAQA